MWILGPMFIKKIRELQFGQVIREDGPERHRQKAGTPSMGGVLICGSIVTATLLWVDLANLYVWTAILVLCGYAVTGFLDDYLKIARGNSTGLRPLFKIFLQVFFVLLAVALLSAAGSWDTHLSIPFFKDFRPDIGFLYVFFAIFVVVGASNAVNLTDGLDGLATGPFIVTSAVYLLFCYLAGHVRLASYLQIPYVAGVGELSVFCGAMVGAGLGFLWFNTYPAEIFMGDTGSLALGGAIGAVAILSKQEILLAIAGGVFVTEAVSVIMQVGFYKLTGGRRIFRMAPVHHHFELLGWKEPKVIVRFWIVSILLGLVAISTLKLR
jgi:phospho-N-acetylmuramoyl-pentapeptide-transferase